MPAPDPEARAADERMYNATVTYYALSIALSIGGFLWLVSGARRRMCS